MGHMVTNVTIINGLFKNAVCAIAMSGVGSNIGNVEMTPVTVWILAVSGWRTSFVVFPVITWIVFLIPSFILMRSQPKNLGLYPDGLPPEKSISKQSPKEFPPTTEREPQSAVGVSDTTGLAKKFVNTGTLRLLVISISLANLAFQGINHSLAPNMQDPGYGDSMVATVITARAIIMAMALPMWRLIAERPHLKLIRAAPFTLQAFGTISFPLAAKPVFMWAAILPYGLGFDGVMVIQEVLWTNYYGRLRLGLVRSTGFPIVFTFSASGPIIMNGIFDLFGSYYPAYALFIGFYLVAGIILWILKEPESTY